MPVLTFPLRAADAARLQHITDLAQLAALAVNPLGAIDMPRKYEIELLGEDNAYATLELSDSEVALLNRLADELNNNRGTYAPTMRVSEAGICKSCNGAGIVGGLFSRPCPACA